MNKIFAFIKTYKKEIAFFFVIYLFLFLNSVHESYPDEMDNILGGYFINKGILPYTGFFTHHGPLAYYFASIITFFAGQSFVGFRRGSTIFILIFLLIGYLVIRKRTLPKFGFYLFYLSLVVLSSSYYWFHMFLADPISGYLFIPAYGILFLKLFRKEALKKIDIILISVFSSLSLMNSPTYSYIVFILAFITFLHYLLFNLSDKKYLSINSLKKSVIFVSIFAAPYLVFVLFLLITGTFKDYYFQALVYNKSYYIYNYPRPPGSTSVNPIRYAIIIINNFLNAYQVLLAAIKNVDFINPFNITLALSNVALWFLLLIRKKYLLFLLSFLLIIFANVRSNPLNVHATDYQAAVYIMLSFFNASFLLFNLKDELKEIQDVFFQLIFKVVAVMLVTYWFFTVIFIFSELWRMSYVKYMGNMSLIYDRPQVANMINAVVPKNDYCWVGPFDFEEILYLNCKTPSRFHIIRPPFKKIESFQKEMISDFTKNKPDIIVYRHNIFSPGREDQFFLNFLDQNYIKLKDYPSPKYKFISDKTQNYYLEGGFFIVKEKEEEIIRNLLRKGYITRR